MLLKVSHGLVCLMSSDRASCGVVCVCARAKGKTNLNSSSGGVDPNQND